MSAENLLDNIMLDGIEEGWIIPIPEPVNPWQYVKDLGCWHNADTGEVMPYCPEDGA